MRGGAPVPPGLGARGFGDVGQTCLNFNKMVAGMNSLKEISDRVDGDHLNVDTYVKELTDLKTEMFRAVGAMFEQEHVRFVSMITAAGSKVGVSGSHPRYMKGIMEHRVLQNLKAVN